MVNELVHICNSRRFSMLYIDTLEQLFSVSLCALDTPPPFPQNLLWRMIPYSPSPTGFMVEDERVHHS